MSISIYVPRSRWHNRGCIQPTYKLKLTFKKEGERRHPQQTNSSILRLCTSTYSPRVEDARLVTGQEAWCHSADAGRLNRNYALEPVGWVRCDASSSPANNALAYISHGPDCSPSHELIAWVRKYQVPDTSLCDQGNGEDPTLAPSIDPNLNPKQTAQEQARNAAASPLCVFEMYVVTTNREFKKKKKKSYNLRGRQKYHRAMSRIEASGKLASNKSGTPILCGIAKPQ